MIHWCLYPFKKDQTDSDAEGLALATSVQLCILWMQTSLSDTYSLSLDELEATSSY